MNLVLSDPLPFGRFCSLEVLQVVSVFNLIPPPFVFLESHSYHLAYNFWQMLKLNFMKFISDRSKYICTI